MSNVNVVKKKENRFAGRRMWFLFAAIAAVFSGLLLFGLLSQLTAKETYYVLGSDIPARTEITPDLLVEETVARGATPPNTLTPADFSEGGLFSLYALQAGDVLSASNVGTLTPLTAGLPNDFVVTSFTVDPSLAAAGNVQRGDYVDIMAVVPAAAGGEENEVQYVLQRVLVIDATVNLDSFQSSEETADEAATGDSATAGVSSDEVAMRSGIPELYTVGLSQENAARLALASQYELFVVLSSADSVGGSVGNGPGPVTLPMIRDENAPNAGEGTDNTFGSNTGESAPEDGTDATQEPSAPTTPSEAPQAPTTPSEGGVEDETVVEETPAP